MLVLTFAFATFTDASAIGNAYNVMGNASWIPERYAAPILSKLSRSISEVWQFLTTTK